LFEGKVSVEPRVTYPVSTAGLQRVAYARLVRKGARPTALSHGPELGAAIRTRLSNADGPCWGALFGYRLDLQPLSVFIRGGFCTGGFQNHVIAARTNEYAVGLGLAHAWDFPHFSAAITYGAGAAITDQRFETGGQAPSRTSTSPFTSVGARLVHEIDPRLLIALELQAEMHLLWLQERSTAEPKLHAELAARSFALVGTQF
jgi:hypothetical protein